MNKKSLLSATSVIEIPFHDCDPMQIVWHGNYARYLEVARCKLLDKIDYNYMNMYDSGYAWPIVDMRIKYVDSARFADEIKVVADLVEYETRMKIEYVIYCNKSGKKLTKAFTVQVAVDLSSNEMQFVTPDVFKNKIEGLLNAV